MIQIGTKFYKHTQFFLIFSWILKRYLEFLRVKSLDWSPAASLFGLHNVQIVIYWLEARKCNCQIFVANGLEQIHEYYRPHRMILPFHSTTLFTFLQTMNSSINVSSYKWFKFTKEVNTFCILKHIAALDGVDTFQKYNTSLWGNWMDRLLEFRTNSFNNVIEV